MGFEWDEEKRRRVLADRKIDFLRVRQLFDGRPTVTYPTPRDAEERWTTVGWIEGHGFAVVWTLRGENVRIITARRARDGEERDYRQLHG